jgi:group I intron endonuclease
MITYVPINLSNRKFYVGSTVNFDRRWKEHLNSSCNYPFQNSLRNNPENFFVLVSEDDGTDSREEEQFYLDFYSGSRWCYNLSSNATAPMLGRNHTEETILKLKQFTMTEEMIQKRRETWERTYGGHPSTGREGYWRDKSRPEHSERMSGEGNPMYGVKLSGSENPAFGRKWWVNSEGEIVFQKESPGKDWQNGKKWKD